jgi:hypothetical protein
VIESGYESALAAVLASRKAAAVKGNTSNLLKLFMFILQNSVVIDIEVSPAYGSTARMLPEKLPPV